MGSTASTAPIETSGTQGSGVTTGRGDCGVGTSLRLRALETGLFVTLPTGILDKPVEHLTVECWVYPYYASGQFPVYVSKFTPDWEGFALMGTKGCEISFAVHSWSDMTSPPYSLPKDTWTHVCGVFDRGEATLYINGSAQGRLTSTRALQPNSSNLCIGSTRRSGSENCYGFTGNIRDLRVWSCSRSPEQINANMTNISRYEMSNLLLWLQLGASGASEMNPCDIGPYSLPVTQTNLVLPARITKDEVSSFSPKELVHGKALLLDSRSHGLQVPSCEGLCPRSELSLEFWFYVKKENFTIPDSVFVSKMDYSKQNCGYGFLGSSRTITFFVNKWFDSPCVAPFPEEKWTHACGVFSNGRKELFLNGESVATNQTTRYINHSKDPLRIGHYPVLNSFEPNQPPYGFCGFCRDVRVWSCARTQHQIRSNMYHLGACDRAGLQAWLPLGSNGFTRDSPLAFECDHGPNALPVLPVGSSTATIFYLMVPPSPVDWSIARLLFIGKYKNSESECVLAVLPVSVIKRILYLL
ncbi:hypothetical protein Pelo_758 [Pelomyxa schiedti]|nr:hypothetical protein Pelo_758 [Pelomyxa schiedti]